LHKNADVDTALEAGITQWAHEYVDIADAREVLYDCLSIHEKLPGGLLV
jgi:hypothetical protein